MRLVHPHDSPSLASIPFTKARAFKARNYRETRCRFIWHYHPEWELTWFRSGSGQRHVGCSIEPFGPDDLVLLAGNLPHTWADIEDNEEQDGDVRCSVIHFLPQVWGEEFWQMPELQAIWSLCGQAVRGVRFTGSGVHAVGRMIEDLASTDGPTFHSFRQLIDIFGDLLTLRVETLNATSTPIGQTPNLRLQELLEWIETRVSTTLVQADVANRLKMSPPYFSRWFRNRMGCTFQRYVSELRVARVCSLLTDPKVSITHAAFEAGFGCLANFNRRFQAIIGQTPREFRARILADVARRCGPNP